MPTNRPEVAEGDARTKPALLRDTDLRMDPALITAASG